MTMKTYDKWENILQRVETAVSQIAKGAMVILTDDASRENEGDLVFAASAADKEKINFMIKYARGLVCLSLDSDLVRRLELPMMQDKGKASACMETAFTVSIDVKEGITTGVSAEDRAKTILATMKKDVKPEDFVVPGHMFPLCAQKGGVLARCGHTEGSLDLVKLAKKGQGAVICEIIKDDGTMARGKDLSLFALRYRLPRLSIADLVAYRKRFDLTKSSHLAKEAIFPSRLVFS